MITTDLPRRTTPKPCIVLLPNRDRCGLPTTYLTAEQTGTYSGYYHVEPGDHGHHAVPSNFI